MKVNIWIQKEIEFIESEMISDLVFLCFLKFHYKKKKVRKIVCRCPLISSVVHKGTLFGFFTILEARILINELINSVIVTKNLSPLKI